MKLIGGLVGIFLMGALVLSGLVAVIASPSPLPGNRNAGNEAVVRAALTLSNHLYGDRSNEYGRDFPTEVLAYWNSICHGCPDMQSGLVQCVMFVLGAYAFAGQPLPVRGDANQLWGLYASQPGWKEVAIGRGMPQPGDVLVWQGGPFGHVAVVVSVVPPMQGRDGSVTVAQANMPGNRFLGTGLPGNWYTMPLHADLTISTWTGYQVQGYLHHGARAGQLPLGVSFSMHYVRLAWDDATQAGIDPVIFVRQINQESGFRPDVTSPAGAEGIAQFVPETAASLDVNPWDPVSALHGAAQLMARFGQQYQGDEAKALAAYNAGSSVVEHCVQAQQEHWLNCLPKETQQYITAIVA